MKYIGFMIRAGNYTDHAELDKLYQQMINTKIDEERKKIYGGILAINPNDQMVALYRALEAFTVNEEEGLKMAIELTNGPDSVSEQWDCLGTMYYIVGRKQEACFAFRCAVHLNAEDEAARFNLAANSMHLGNYDDALLHIYKCLRSDHVPIDLDVLHLNTLLLAHSPFAAHEKACAIMAKYGSKMNGSPKEFGVIRKLAEDQNSIQEAIAFYRDKGDSEESTVESRRKQLAGSKSQLQFSCPCCKMEI